MCGCFHKSEQAARITLAVGAECLVTETGFREGPMQFGRSKPLNEKCEHSEQRTVHREHEYACCITKATDTHSEYVTLIAFPLQQWLHERA